jgi:hypothetical protein
MQTLFYEGVHIIFSSRVSIFGEEINGITKEKEEEKEGTPTLV